MDTVTAALVEIGRAVRGCIRTRFPSDGATWARPAAEGVSDVQYALDVLVEDELLRVATAQFAGMGPLRLLSEGLGAEGVVVFEGGGGRLLVVDPVDGTRGLMHDKRSAWFLAGLAPDGEASRLRDLTHACLLEIPTSRSMLSDVLTWSTDAGLEAWTEDLDGNIQRPLALRATSPTGVSHGFMTISRFTGGAGAALGALQDALLEALFPGDGEAPLHVFEDQYIANGGQLHALITGRDVFVADLRPLFRRRDGGRLLCAHPYDLLALPIAEAAGVVVTDAGGNPLDAPLDLATDVAWVGYGSEALRQRIEPALREACARVLGG